MSLAAAGLLAMTLSGCADDTLGPVEPEVAQILVADARFAKGSGSTTVVSPSSISIEAGQTVQLVATDASGNPVSARWSSSNTVVATVSSEGLVQGVASGTATITAKSKSQSAQATVNVVAAATPATDFAAVVRGVRPRGFGTGTYTLLSPADGGTAWYVSPDGSDSNPGTQTKPFQTINRAAQAAQAGDVVTIAAGTYRESVLVRNSGTADRRIVFQAAERGEVVLTGGAYSFQPRDWAGDPFATRQSYITVRGLIFQEYSDLSNPDMGAVRAALGWRVEDCLFDRSAYTGVNIKGSHVEIVRSTIQYHLVHAMVSWAPDTGTSPSDPDYKPVEGLRVIDVVLRGNHTTSTPLTGTVGTYVAKFLMTRGTLLDNVESYENNGAGFWLDTKNTDFVIRNSYFHHNKGFATDGAYNPERGRGIYIEKNWGTGLIENNVFANNEGTGVFLVNSSGVTVRGNLMYSNAQCVTFVNMTTTGYEIFPLKDVRVLNNSCKDWAQHSGVHALGGTFTSPASMGIHADHNVYEPVRTAALAWWPEIGDATTIPEMQKDLGWEHNGSVGTIATP